MHISASVPAGEAIPEPGVRPVRGPPAGRAGGPAEAILRLAEDRDRIAAGMNDIVVSRLFAAGLSLETALSLMGDHPAAGRIQEAIGELDLAIRDFRDVLFDHHRPGSPSSGRPG
jgi:signal transduction histidine kinase